MQTLPTDTLTCDISRLSLWRNDPDYDYARGLMEATEGPVDRLRRWLMNKLYDWFDWTLNDSQMNWLFVAVVLVCVLLVVWFVWKKHPGLFRRVGAVSRPANDVEDTIYGINFGNEIRRAVEKDDYYTAVRYTYLHVLKQYHDAGRINWQPYKTPTDYVYELRFPEAQPDFRRLTNAFLRVRYGNHHPDRAFYEDTERLADSLSRLTVKEGGES